MKIHDINAIDNELLMELTIDCSKCSGLCCTALFFSKMDGFPENKAAGVPCVNLQKDYRCKIHDQLINRKMKGCLGYDCFGAGQKVTSLIYKDITWYSQPDKAQEIFDVFLIVFQIHQILYYLAEAKTMIPAKDLWEDLIVLIKEGRDICKASHKEILKFDVDQYRKRVNESLRKVSNHIKLIYNQGKDVKKISYIGKNFIKQNFNGMDFTMDLLIAANFEGCSFNGTSFLGADTRDTNFSNADLSEAVFLTQGQVNSAQGNSGTKLPRNISRPNTWVN